MNDKRIAYKNKLDDGLTFKISPFKPQIKKTTPHKHDEYYELIFIEKGEGFHTIEAEQYMVMAPDFYLLKPGQLHYWQFTSIPGGFVILLKEDEFDAIKESILIEMLRKLSETARLRLESESNFFHLLDVLSQEYNKSTSYSREICHGLLKALMGKLLQLTKRDKGNSILPQNPFDRFQALLVTECPRLRKVHQYANILNMTPQNLNILCRRHAGKSASELITSQIMLEAKRYILHTSNTINEIADILSFSDTSNFVKFFKKNEGVTPAQFREKYFQ